MHTYLYFRSIWFCMNRWHFITTVFLTWSGLMCDFDHQTLKDLKADSLLLYFYFFYNIERNLSLFPVNLAVNWKSERKSKGIRLVILQLLHVELADFRSCFRPLVLLPLWPTTYCPCSIPVLQQQTVWCLSYEPTCVPKLLKKGMSTLIFEIINMSVQGKIFFF